MSSPLDISRLWRAQVDSGASYMPARTFFVESATPSQARHYIAVTVAVFGGYAPVDVDHRIRELKSAGQLIDEGRHADTELRIFELGWNADGAILVAEPVFLLAHPGPFCRRWAEAIFAGGACT